MSTPGIDNIDYIRATRAQWIDAVGRFIVACGGCEWGTRHFLRVFDAGSGYDLNPKLEPRAVRIRELLASGRVQEPQPGRVSTALGRLELLQHDRNLVAHDAPAIEVHVSRSSDEHAMVQQYRGTRNRQKTITLAALQGLATEAERLEVELWAAVQAATPSS